MPEKINKNVKLWMSEEWPILTPLRTSLSPQEGGGKGGSAPPQKFWEDFLPTYSKNLRVSKEKSLYLI